MIFLRFYHFKKEYIVAAATISGNTVLAGNIVLSYGVLVDLIINLIHLCMPYSLKNKNKKEIRIILFYVHCR